MDADSAKCSVADCHEQCNYYDDNNHNNHKIYQGNAGESTAVCYIIYRVRLLFFDATTSTATSTSTSDATSDATATVSQLLADHAKRKSAADSLAVSARLLSAHTEQSADLAEHSGLLSVTADRATAAVSSLSTAAAASLSGAASGADAHYSAETAV